MTSSVDDPTARPTRRLLNRDERQAQILRTAATAFAGAGFAGTSMDDVAAQAGVTKLIVYRHFSSKEELYRAVLTRVGQRLQEEFTREAGVAEADRSPGFATRSLLTVARENPDGFRLLTRHASREPEFVDLVKGFHTGSQAVAESIIGGMIPDPTVKAWASAVIVDYLIQSVLSWLDVGDEDRDDEFVTRSTRGLRGLFLAWADPGRIPRRVRAALDREIAS